MGHLCVTPPHTERDKFGRNLLQLAKALGDGVSCSTVSTNHHKILVENRLVVDSSQQLGRRHIPAWSSFCMTEALALSNQLSGIWTYGNGSHHASRRAEHSHGDGASHFGERRWSMAAKRLWMSRGCKMSPIESLCLEFRRTEVEGQLPGPQS